jgi:hypothetical protein
MTSQSGCDTNNRIARERLRLDGKSLIGDNFEKVCKQ